MAGAQVDASITANIGKNAISNFSEIANTVNALNQNKLFQGRQAAGQALQRAIDPDTGQVDFAKANALIAANPRVAPYAQEAMREMLAGQGQQIGNITAQRNLQQSQGDYVRTVVGALGDKATPETVLGALRLGAATGQIDPKFAATVAGSMPGDPAQIGAWAQNNFQLPALGVQGALNATSPQPTAINTGGKIDLVKTPQIGAPEPVGALDLTLSPEAKASPVDVVDPATGQHSTVPRSAVVSDTGEPVKNGPFTGSKGEIIASLPAGSAEARSVAGQSNAQMAQALVQRASKVRDNKAILGNMDGLLDNFQPGPQSGFWKNLGQIAAEYGIKLPGAPPKDKTAAQEEFGKLAFQLAQTQFQALGGTGTDSKLDSTMHTSPSELMSRYGNKGIIALLKGNEDAVLAQSDAWQKWQDAGHGPETYGKFLNQWNKIYDPRVFQSQYMTAPERQTMLKGMTKAEQQQFETSYKRAAGLGWVQ